MFCISWRRVNNGITRFQCVVSFCMSSVPGRIRFYLRLFVDNSCSCIITLSKYFLRRPAPHRRRWTTSTTNLIRIMPLSTTSQFLPQLSPWFKSASSPTLLRYAFPRRARSCPAFWPAHVEPAVRLEQCASATWLPDHTSGIRFPSLFHFASMARSTLHTFTIRVNKLLGQLFTCTLTNYHPTPPALSEASTALCLARTRWSTILFYFCLSPRSFACNLITSALQTMIHLLLQMTEDSGRTSGYTTDWNLF